MGSADDEPSGGLDGLLRRGDPSGDMEERRSLAAVERGLFGRAKEPERFGRYVLGKSIGAGGVGVVYAAWDPELDRTVAVKVVATTHRLGEPQLRREAQAMARVVHPCVAEVFDVGVRARDGAPYIVMERVDGMDARRWLQTGPHPLAAILRVFTDAARGLSAAHAAGIVHRDFKPSNVLLQISAHGAIERVAVSDFGLAWLTRETDPANEDASRSGTPRYMAPEQHAGRAPDAKSDQYALCVALWEAVVGAPPFAGSDLAALAAAKAEVPTRHRELAPWLFRLLRRGLQPDPSRRFATVDALIDALVRGTDRRRRWTRSAGLMFVATPLIVLGIAGDTGGSRCEAAARQIATVYDETRAESIARTLRAADATEETVAVVIGGLDAHHDRWVEERHSACLAGRDRGRSSRGLCLDRSLTELHAVVQALEIADVGVAREASSLVAAMRSPSRCAQPNRAATGGPGRTIGGELFATISVGRLETETAHADVALRLGRYGPALAGALRVAAAASRAGHKTVEARALLIAADAANNGADPNQPEELARRGYEVAVAAGDSRLAAAAAMRLVGLIGVRRDDFDGAQRWAGHARAWIDRLGDAPELEANLLRLRGVVAARRDRPGAVDLLQRAARLADEGRGDAAGDRHVVRTHWDLGQALMIVGRYDEALDAYRTVLSVLEPMRGDAHPKVGQAHRNVGAALVSLGRPGEAQPHLDRARDTALGTAGRESRAFVEVEGIFAELEAKRGQHDQALSRRERLVEIIASVRGARHPSLAAMQLSRAVDLAALGKASEATAVLERARIDLEETLAPERRVRAALRVTEAEALLRLGRIEEAHQAAAFAVTALEGQGEDPALGGARIVLASVHLARGHEDAAVGLLESVVRARSPKDPFDPMDAQALLAQVVWETQPARARRLAARAINGYREQWAEPKAAALDRWVRARTD